MTKNLIDNYRFIIYDVEVFAHDWLAVFKDGDNWYHFWNNASEVVGFLEENKDAIFTGFNNKHYDNFILLAISIGLTPEEVKEINDYIIDTGKSGWTQPYLENYRFNYNFTDLRDDMDKGLSLKAIEGHLGLPIRESSVPFDYPDKLDDEQKYEVLTYCKYDVETTAKLFELRKDYIETKLVLAELGSIEPLFALKMTDPKLAACYMGAENKEFDDERNYVFPADKIDRDLIPDEIYNFFDTIHDESISDEDLFGTKLETTIGNCPVTLAWGGIHGAVAKYREAATEDRLILNYDVSSLYPSLMIEYGYVSRAVPDPTIFKQIREDRFEAKAKGDKKTANALKSPLNKTYGAMLNQYNPMYDPLMARSVCISGQLSMVMLAEMYLKYLTDVRILQINTDGIMISIPSRLKAVVTRTNTIWQEKTHLQLEEDQIELIWQKDVNNYVMRKTDGSVKVKGGYLSRGINPIGAWSINNQAPIVADAIKEYLLYGTTPEEIISRYVHPDQFQLIAKAGAKYSMVYHELYELNDEGEIVYSYCDKDIQKCNRVFAIKDKSFGRLYKVKAVDGSVAKIENLPDHCGIYNETWPNMDQIDKQWYVDLAWKRINDFKEKTMPAAKKETTEKATESVDYKSLNIYQKLALARKMFLDAKPKKSGKNSHLEFMYFELDDIAPIQTEIFEKVGLLEIFTYDEGIDFVDTNEGSTERKFEPCAISTVVNVDNPMQQIVFKSRWTDLQPIISRNGNAATNEVQTYGMVQTYLRRYNKMMILDIAEPDSLDASAKKTKTKAKSASTSSKATPVGKTERDNAIKSVTGRSKATKQQIQTVRQIIGNMKSEYGEDHPEVGAYAMKIGEETDRLTNVTKEQCDEIIRKFGEMKKSYDESTEE